MMLDLWTSVLLVSAHLLCFESFAQEQVVNVNQLAGQSIVLDHDQNDLRLEYVALHFDAPEKIQYKYQLEGLHSEWVNAGHERVARFTNLHPGNYVFKLLAANPDGVWSKEPVLLSIRIRPPWYWSTWSKLSYLSVIAAGLYGIYLFQINRRLKIAEVEKLREMDEVKAQLYTNITHEFRTPLTVIQGLANQIEGQEKIKKTIERNSVNLLDLVNQMMDLSKLERGKMRVNLIQANVVDYMSYLMESFQSFAASRKIRLHFIPQMKVFNMDYDPDKLLKIVANLMSNAIKFTEPGGDVYVVVSTNKLLKSLSDAKPKLNALITSKESLIIQVRDTGIGISEDDLRYVFDRFYQVSNKQRNKHHGTGIGLAFTQELVRLLRGQIYVESELGKGSLFTVILPVTREFLLVSGEVAKDVVSGMMVSRPDRTKSITEVVTQDSDLPLVLIVEDNADVRNYISQCLKRDFQISLAVDGQQGIELARDIIPDLVISDVMMPKKDGYELCQEIKKDRRTSHIPVILLTAKVEAASRITGLRAGADAYLGKPFNEEELLVRAEQLIASRKRLQERYQQGISTISLQTKNSDFQREDSFILEVQKAIIDHLDDENFDSEKLCRIMGMSLSPLYRKIKALTGRSTAVYIRSVRLTRAYELLRQTERSVSEIAYEVGFKDAAYFSRCFSEEYGESPRSVRN